MLLSWYLLAGNSKAWYLKLLVPYPALLTLCISRRLEYLKLYKVESLKHINPFKYEPRHDKINKVTVRPAKTQISLGIRTVWSESSLSARRKLGSLATHEAHSEDSDQTGRMPRLIWVFARRRVTLLVLSCGGSYCGERPSAILKVSIAGVLSLERWSVVVPAFLIKSS